MSSGNKSRQFSSVLGPTRRLPPEDDLILEVARVGRTADLSRGRRLGPCQPLGCAILLRSRSDRRLDPVERTCRAGPTLQPARQLNPPWCSLHGRRETSVATSTGSSGWVSPHANKGAGSAPSLWPPAGQPGHLAPCPPDDPVRQRLRRRHEGERETQVRPGQTECDDSSARCCSVRRRPE